jgi:hypothetical protein
MPRPYQERGGGPVPAASHQTISGYESFAALCISAVS